MLIDDPHRFDGVRVIGVDEQVWRHTKQRDKYVTVIIDLTPVEEKRGPARLLDMVPGRSKQVFSNWLKARPTQWRNNIEVVAMDGFTGFKTATTEHLPDATVVMDPFHVVHIGRSSLRLGGNGYAHSSTSSRKPPRSASPSYANSATR